MSFRDETIHAACDPPSLRCDCGGKLRKSKEFWCWECPRCGVTVDSQAVVESDWDSEAEPDGQRADSAGT
jgi:hypothetical protein